MLCLCRHRCVPRFLPTLGRDAILGGGDDYELLVAVPPGAIEAFAKGAAHAGIGVSDIGCFKRDSRLRFRSRGTRIEAPAFRLRSLFALKSAR